MKISLVILLGVLTAFSVKAQNIYSLNNELSSIQIKGTSSLHDWESDVEKFEGSAQLESTDENPLILKELHLSIDVESIESGKGIMNKKTYSALDSKKHPSILFEFSELTQITQDSVFVTGILTIAGEEQLVNLSGAYQLQNNSMLKLSGSYSLLMSDYGIKPPKAMLGSLKTGDEVEIVFDVIFENKQEQ